MTSETRITFTPSDFKAIEFECSECHHRIVRPMTVWKSILYMCPDCGSDWSQFAGTMKYLANMASQLPKFTPPIDGEKWPFTIRFEIAQEKEKQ
jgi:hypothetical protein